MNTGWRLSLFVAGVAPESVRARSNLDALISTYLSDVEAQIEVIDLLEKPSIARERNILALPTLIRETPEPVTRVVGDLSDVERLWSVLQVS